MKLDENQNPDLVGNESAGNTEVNSQEILIESSGLSSVTVPDGFKLTDAEFNRDGSDLVLEQGDTNLVLRDYFGTDTPPPITTPDGIVISGDLANSLAGPLAPAQVAQATPTAGAEAIGAIESTTGTASAVRVDGTEITLQAGDPIFQGDIIRTGADSSVGIIFVDNTTFALADEGEMTLDEMVYDAGTQEGSAHISMVKGVFSFVSGQIAKTGADAMTLTTPVATIGIRGTAGSGSVSENAPLSIVLTAEPDGSIGEIIVTNAAGVVVLNQPFQATSVTSFNAPPNQVFTMTVAEFNNTFSSVTQSLPPQPTGDEGAQAAAEAEAEAAAAEAEAEAQAATPEQ